MSPVASTLGKSLVGVVLITTLVLVCVAILAQAQYNTYDSGSSSDSDGSPILTSGDVGKYARNSARAQAAPGANNMRFRNHKHQQAATRNMYNRQQPSQYAPTQHRRQYGADSDSLAGYNPMLGLSASHGRQHGASASNNNNDDDEAGNFGPNFNSNFDANDNDGDGANADGHAMNLQKAASGFPGARGDYNDAGAGGFNGFGTAEFGPSSGGDGSDGSDYGPAEGFANEGHRAKSASSLMGQNYGAGDDNSVAPRFGPNSAVNSGERDVDEDARGSRYAPEGANDTDNDDE